MKNTENLIKRLRRGIATAKGIDNDFVFITIGDAKKILKMLDEKLTLEGCFDIVLWCRTDGKRHWFQTQSDGFNTAKSPEDMFDAEIPNDLAFVDKTIREYYGMEPLVNNEEKEGNVK